MDVIVRVPDVLMRSNGESDPAQRRMWLVWVLVRFAGVALITGVLWYPAADGDVIFIYHAWATHLLHGQLPWRDFKVEYPPGVLPGMLLPGGRSVYELQFVCIALLADGYIMKALWRQRRNGLGTWCWVFAPIALGPIMWTRYDIFVAAALVGFLVSMRKGNWKRAGACLAAATLIKMWPIALLLVLWRLIPVEGRRKVAGWAIGVSAAACAPVVAWGGLGGLHYVLTYQGDRGIEWESPWALPVQIAHSFDFSVPLVRAHDTIEYALSGWAQPATSAVLPLLILAIAAFAWLDRKQRLTVSSATLLTVVAVIFGEKVLSAQYVVWGAAIVVYAINDSPLRTLRQRWHLVLATLAWGITTQLFWPLYAVYVYYGWFRGNMVAITHAEAVFVWAGIATFFVLRPQLAEDAVDVPEPRAETVPAATRPLLGAPF
jgi:hypothetical protein